MRGTSPSRRENGKNTPPLTASGSARHVPLAQLLPGVPGARPKPRRALSASVCSDLGLRIGGPVEARELVLSALGERRSEERSSRFATGSVDIGLVASEDCARALEAASGELPHRGRRRPTAAAGPAGNRSEPAERAMQLPQVTGDSSPAGRAAASPGGRCAGQRDEAGARPPRLASRGRPLAPAHGLPRPATLPARPRRLCVLLRRPPQNNTYSRHRP